jgi:hypothetical protein
MAAHDGARIMNAPRIHADPIADRFAVRRDPGAPALEITLDPDGPDEATACLPLDAARRLGRALLAAASDGPRIDLRAIEVIRLAEVTP